MPVYRLHRLHFSLPKKGGSIYNSHFANACEGITSMIDSETLKSLYKSDILYDDDMANLAVMISRKKIEKEHTKKYKIYKRKGSKEGYVTVLPGSNGKKIERKTKEALLDALLEYYIDPRSKEIKEMSLYNLYHKEWIRYKASITDSPNTIETHNKHFRKYFSEEGIFHKPMAKITTEELTVWANQLIKKHRLSSRQWQTIKTIPKQMFEYAFLHGYIQYNPFADVKVTVRFRQVSKKSGFSETFNTDEYELILQDLWNSYYQKKDIRFLAVIFNFYLGLRVGELTGLKWEDLENGFLHVRRELTLENAEQVNSGLYEDYFRSGEFTVMPDQKGHKWMYVLVGHTKTNSERIVPVIPKAQAVLDTIIHDFPKEVLGEYIFAERGSFLSTRSVNSVLEYACKHIGISIKRSHKIRKTWASRANIAGIPLDAIREHLGHASLNTTLGYIYNCLPIVEIIEKMATAF